LLDWQNIYNLLKNKVKKY